MAAFGIPSVVIQGAWLDHLDILGFQLSSTGKGKPSNSSLCSVCYILNFHLLRLKTLQWTNMLFLSTLLF
ncbi:hypothetical protein Y1Q_0014810 [Alligator mississippiensis]|uniref:Uncharacterized protein n=1 Tax=Alligator mississippiensis TaxID=8496 RepID=A0A151M220_ALLMI|nr:hypothetical protein Y1Q_0014810 [Alligator mississippiensis]